MDISMCNSNALELPSSDCAMDETDPGVVANGQVVQPSTEDEGHFMARIRPWMLPYDTLKLKRVLGKGSAGSVYLGEWQSTDVAVKLLDTPIAPIRSGTQPATGLDALPNADSKEGNDAVPDRSNVHWRSLEREVNILASLRHPHIVMFMGACIQPPCLVMEWCARGSLFDLLCKARTQPGLAVQLSWHVRLTMALQAAKGMLQLHCHKPTILHRDLKTGNIMIDASWHAKIGDFNLSHMEGAPAVLCQSIADNPRYIAPEVMNGAKHSKESDVYAYALILWELLTFLPPWEDLSALQIVQAVVARHERPEIPDDISSLPGGTFCAIDAYLDLLKRCWADDLKERPTFEGIILEVRQMLDKQIQKSRATAARSVDIFGAPRPVARQVQGVVSKKPSKFDDLPSEKRQVNEADQLFKACQQLMKTHLRDADLSGVTTLHLLQERLGTYSNGQQPPQNSSIRVRSLDERSSSGAPQPVFRGSSMPVGWQIPRLPTPYEVYSSNAGSYTAQDSIASSISSGNTTPSHSDSGVFPIGEI